MAVNYEHQLQEMAEQATALAALIHQDGWPMPGEFQTRVRAYPSTDGPDRALQEIEAQLGGVAAAIHAYLQSSGA